MTRVLLTLGGALAALLLAGCGQKEVPLPGERFDLRGEPVVSTTAQDNLSVPFAAPPVQQNTDWSHRAGNAAKTPLHPALSASLSPVWSARIGAGDGRRHRISADPVVAGGRIFTLDSRATVTAVSTAGAVLWSADLTPGSDRADDASGGGLASDGARVYASSGFGRITALDAATGAELWVQRLGAAATAAPTVADGVVYVVGADSTAWALDAETGRIVWDVAGTPSPSGVLGGASPAVTDRLVVLPFTSAELAGVLKLSGLRVWSAPLQGQRDGRVYANINDVSGDPIIVGERIYAGNPAGRTVALDLTNGERIWTVEEGALSPVQVAGGSVFLISDQNELLRLDGDTGERIWTTPLPYFTKERVRRRRDIFEHYGPVLAGGRLVVASGDGLIRFFDPTNGAALGQIALPGGAASLPAIAGGTLYAVSGSGQLHAFR